MRHKVIHTLEKPYQCSQRDMAFVRTTQTHTGEKQYQCCQRGKAFVRPTLTHIGEEPHHAANVIKIYRIIVVI